jgi:hypothetical protein
MRFSKASVKKLVLAEWIAVPAGCLGTWYAVAHMITHKLPPLAFRSAREGGAIRRATSDYRSERCGDDGPWKIQVV